MFNTRIPHSRAISGAKRVSLFANIGCAAIIVFLSSCSAVLPVQHEAQQSADRTLAAPYSIVCIIHGDGDYLYHDAAGNEHKADEAALTHAQRVAEQNPFAEVFIFHQKPKRNLLFFFPLRDGEFFYYQNGRLIANESYWRDQAHSRFTPEVELYRHFHTDIQPKQLSIFLYCGHEIPEFGGAGYDASVPDRTFTIHDLATGLKGFMRDSARFDLMALSTCFGGTPYTIATLAPSARYIIASPDNLHLSYFDLRLLERLDSSLQTGDVHVFAKRFARESFDRLTSDVQTSVSIAVYDADRAQEYLQSVCKIYNGTLTMLKGMTRISNPVIRHCDCADLPAYVLPAMNEGVDVFYRPAFFGRSKNKQKHSGWECLQAPESKPSTSQTASPLQR